MEVKIKKFNELSAGEIYEILKSRCEVFMLEQSIICQDMDGVDYESYHVFIEEKNRVIAYLRVYSANLDTAQIGRVLTLERKKGLGTLIMKKAEEFAKINMNCKKITLHSQKTAQGFYEKLGYTPVGEYFLEEGVEHITMEKRLIG